ncbi:hypothetical protein E2C01_082152 [Portunus trituberculatus]|uniref:Uncharacterized protein n=1 Tax=Portunus trituberculatus TaxID=210409 RepID=A0A5B7J446_PORTR|nr:hypothetical protein [Portunus trituberculatus]
MKHSGLARPTGTPGSLRHEQQERKPGNPDCKLCGAKQRSVHWSENLPVTVTMDFVSPTLLSNDLK